MMATAVSKMAHYAQGGPVGGKGTGDKVRALLDPREVVLPPDTVNAVGLTTLKALIAATHKPTGKSKGGRVRRMADGGLVGDDPTKKDEPLSYGQQMGKVGGAIADAASAVAKTVVGAPGYGLNAVTGASEPPSAVATMSKPAPAAPPTPYTQAADSQAAYPAGQQQVPVPNGYTGLAGNPLATDPSIHKSVDAAGNVLYSNQSLDSDAALTARSQPSAQNVSAVDALAARYAGNSAATAQYKQDVADANATNAQPARADTGGFGLLDKATLQARNAKIGAEAPTSRQAVQLAVAQGQNATTRDVAQTGAVSRLASSNIAAEASKYGHDTSAETAAARLATETPGIQAKTQLTTQQVAQQQKLQDLQKQYLAATDPAQRRQLYEALIASQGHVRSLAEKYTVVPQGSQVDPATGIVTHNPSKLFDNQLGKEITLSEPTSGAGSGAAKAAPPANHIAALKANPALAAQFDQQYGPGASKKYLGGQ